MRTGAACDEATNGRVGYVYVPDTGVNGAERAGPPVHGAVVARTALIVDERFNSGGQIPDRFIELLNRPMLNLLGRARRRATGNGRRWRIRGPKVMLINGWSGSGGDAFPFYFREARLGPLIGTRTWGGLIGISGAPALVDGGAVTVPTFGMYSTDGKWFIEGHGVDPDIAGRGRPGAARQRRGSPARARDPGSAAAARGQPARAAEQAALPEPRARDQHGERRGGTALRAAAESKGGDGPFAHPPPAP